MITIEQHKGVNVLRDDLLTGGEAEIENYSQNER